MAIGKVEQADGKSRRAGNAHQYLKRQKNRIERRRAKKDPECTPEYGKYRGYEL